MQLRRLVLLIILSSVGFACGASSGGAPTRPEPTKERVAPSSGSEARADSAETPVEPVDGDGDGVAGAEDQCPEEPETKNGVVDVDGCADFDGDYVRFDGSRVVLNEPVLFEVASAELHPSAFAVLDELAGVLKAHPRLERVVVEVHTDHPKPDLTKARAEAIREYLVDKGVAAERVVAEGLADRWPVASRDTEEGRAKNRRVEIRSLAVSVVGSKTPLCVPRQCPHRMRGVYRNGCGKELRCGYSRPVRDPAPTDTMDELRPQPACDPLPCPEGACGYLNDHCGGDMFCGPCEGDPQPM